jgi:UDP-N-acetylglucosamine 2-epimerase (non-hydrolysing)
MKVMTLFGTRPEIIRLCQVIKRLDQVCDQILVHTGQNFDPNLSDIFFKQLNVRKPNIELRIHSSSFADQTGQIIARVGEVLEQEKPDRLLILGDTNSGLAAIVAARMRIPVYHMEAGNRCYDDRVPEEINRRIIDHCSNVLMPYTYRSKENLVREGIERERIFVIGNPIFEVLKAHAEAVDESPILDNFGIKPQEYFLATAHRAENVDDAVRLENLLVGLQRLSDHYGFPVVISVHPRTASKIGTFGIETGQDLKLIEPMGFFDFIALERNALCVISDSGTVQEECAIFRVPNVTIRDVTERPETLECGSNVLSGVESEKILNVTQMVLALPHSWEPPAEYLVPDVSLSVAKILLGFRRTI